jgi:hypothetical protein
MKKPDFKKIKSSPPENPYNPLNPLYKKMTKFFSGPINTYKTPQAVLNKRRDLNKYDFISPEGLPFKKKDSSSPIDYLYSRVLGNIGRLERYQDFDAMDFTPEINSALDIYASEITTYTEFSPMIKISSNNDEIKQILRSLFEDVLNITDNLFSWVRAMCKYGDFFLYLDMDEKTGIKSFIGFRPSEIERLEGIDESNPNYIRFQWNSGGLSFENWQMIHFRVLGDDRFFPYGCSVLAGARRIFKQLDLLENAVISYRIVRSSEKRVFYIDVASIPPEDVEQYINRIVSNIKENTVVDTETGRADKRYNPQHSVEKDYFLAVRGSGTGTKIETLPGGAYTGDVDDIKYFRDKLFSALKIPGAYLAQTEAVEDKMSLAQKDLMFGRTIMRIQNSIVAELKKVAMIHLYFLGFRGKDLLDFDIKLNNPSKIAELQELEHLRTRADLAGSLTEGFFSKEFVYKKIFGLSDLEILEQRAGIFSDAKQNILLQQLSEVNTSEGGGGPAGGLGGSEDFGSSGLIEPGDVEPPSPEGGGILKASPSEDEIGNLKTDLEGEAGKETPEKPEAPPPETKTGEEAKRNEEYYTDRSKGKAYTKVNHDHRTSTAPRNKQNKAAYSKALSSNSYSNIFQGAMGMKSFGKGIIPDSKDVEHNNDVRKILDNFNVIKQNKELIIEKDNYFAKFLIERMPEIKEDDNNE